MEFNFIKEESHVDDEQMEAHHVHKGKTEYDEVRLTKIETDVRKLKELILGKTECNEFRMTKVETDVRELKELLLGKRKYNEVRMTKAETDVRELKELMLQLLQYELHQEQSMNEQSARVEKRDATPFVGAQVLEKYLKHGQ